MSPPLPSPGRRARTAAALLGVAGALLAGCPEPAPLQIGFLGGLTGRGAELGTAGRDGATLAVEEQNARGGIHGRRVAVLTADDRQDAATARWQVRRLLDAGVVGVVGPMTSAMAMATVPIVTERRVVMIAPTVGTDQLTGQDDHFLRVYPSCAQHAERLARHAAVKLGLARVAVVYDLSNAAYTESWRESFDRAFRRHEGRITRAYAYRSGPRPYFSELAAELHGTDADGVLALSGAMDTALLIQHLRTVGSAVPVLATEWSATDAVLQHGGAAVDGMLLLQTIDRHSARPEYTRFQRAFEERFGYAPGFAAIHAYDATRLLLAGLARTTEPAALKAELLALGSFEAVQGTSRLDRFGDASGPYFLVTVRDGRFVAVGAP